MFERVLSFLKELPGGGAGDSVPREDDPRIAAAALMYHVVNADGVLQDAEWERIKDLLAETYGVGGRELDELLAAGRKADLEAVDLYQFTSVLKRHLDAEARIEFIRVMWEVVFADGEAHELEDHTLWRVAELIGVDRRDRIHARQDAQSQSAGASGHPVETE
jgi:uncharacterized tellurite resistance protein B-like protein